MVVAEYRSPGAVVRIHDEYCEKEPTQRLNHLNYIITESYKRRQLEINGQYITALKIEGNGNTRI